MCSVRYKSGTEYLAKMKNRVKEHVCHVAVGYPLFDKVDKFHYL